MKKISVFAVLVLLLACAWTGAAWYTGKRLEAENQAGITKLNAALKARSMGVTLSVVNESYQRGVFSSKARYGVRIQYGAPTSDEPGTAAAMDVAAFDVDVEHGPFPRSRLAAGHWAPRAAAVHAALARTDTLQPLFDLTKGRSFLVSDAVFGYGGDADFSWHLLPLDARFDDAALKFSGAAGSGSYLPGSQAFHMRADVDNLMLSGQGGAKDQVQLQGIAMNMDSHAGKFGIMPGSASLDIRQIAADSPASQAKTLTQGLRYAATLDEDGTSLNARFEYLAHATTVNDLDLGEIQARISLAHLDGKAVQHLAQIYPRIAGSLMPGGASPLQNQELMDALLALLDGHPTITLDPMRWKTAHGESHLSVSMDLAKPDLAQAGEPEQLLLEIIKRLDAGANLSRPMALDVARALAPVAGWGTTAASQDGLVTQLFQTVQASGLFKEKNGDLSSSIHLADGVIDLNGERKPAPEMLGRILLGEQDNAGQADAGAAPVTLHGFVKQDMEALVKEAGWDSAWIDQDGKLPTQEIATDAGDPVEFIDLQYPDCDGPVCPGMTLKAVFKPSKKPASPKAMDNWNQGAHGSRIYLDEKKKLVLEMDISADGLARDEALSRIRTFMTQVPEFPDAALAVKHGGPASRSGQAATASPHLLDGARRP